MVTTPQQSLSWPPTLMTTDHFTVSIVLPFLECHIHSWNHMVCFSCWLLSLRNMHLIFLHVLSWLDSSFTISQLFFLSIHLLKDNLVASNLGNGESSYKYVCKFLHRHKFSTFLSKYQRVQLLGHMVDSHHLLLILGCIFFTILASECIFQFTESFSRDCYIIVLRVPTACIFFLVHLQKWYIIKIWPNKFKSVFR